MRARLRAVAVLLAAAAMIVTVRVVAHAEAQPVPTPPPSASATPTPSPVPPEATDARATLAITTAMAQLGLPYVWGGNGPAAGDAGFDCSGLTHFAYGVAGIRLPRTASDQFYAGPVVAKDAPLHPGDLVFYGTAADVHHVGLYLGDGRMVNATTFGEPIKVAYSRWPGDDYFGATRPTVPPHAADVAPAPPRPAPSPLSRLSRIFEAPAAPPPEWLMRRPSG